MRRWAATLPNPVVDVSYEETVADPVGTAASILVRFGLPVDHAALSSAAGDDGRQLNLSPGRSLDGVGALSRDLVGFSARFAKHLGPVLPAYLEERAKLA